MVQRPHRARYQSRRRASTPEDPTRFLPSFWQGLGLLALYVALGIAFRTLAAVLPTLGVAVPVLLSPLPAALSYLFALRIGRRWTRLTWREALPFPLPSLAQVGAFLVLFAGLELASNGLATIVEGWLPPAPGWKAIGLSTLLFALVHAIPWQLASPLLAGLVLGWVAVRTGSLWLPVIGHAMHNGRVVLAENGMLPAYLGSRPGLDTSGWLTALLLTFAGALLLARATKRDRPTLADVTPAAPTQQDPTLPTLGRPPSSRYPPPA